MLKIVFQFFVMGVTVLVAANSSQAASFEYLYGQLRPTAEAAPISTVGSVCFRCRNWWCFRMRCSRCTSLSHGTAKCSPNRSRGIG